MGRFLAYRFLALIASLVLASAVIFVVLRQLPGDAGGATLGVGTTADQLAQLRADLGTDLPVWQQYTTWIASLFDGSTTSFISREPVSDLIASKLPITVPLSLAAFVVAVLVSIPLGVLAGIYRDSPLGVIVSGVSQLGLAIPIFGLVCSLCGGSRYGNSGCHQEGSRAQGGRTQVPPSNHSFSQL